MHSSCLPFPVPAEPLLSVALKLFWVCCVCVCFCVSALTHMSCVTACANKDNSMFDLGVHPHCVCQCAKLYLLNEQEGCCLCSSHWKGNINLRFVAHVLWEKEAGFRETKEEAFKNPPVLLRKLILHHHQPFYNCNLEVNKLWRAAYCISNKVLITIVEAIMNICSRTLILHWLFVCNSNSNNCLLWPLTAGLASYFWERVWTERAQSSTV